MGKYSIEYKLQQNFAIKNSEAHRERMRLGRIRSHERHPKLQRRTRQTQERSMESEMKLVNSPEEQRYLDDQKLAMFEVIQAEKLSRQRKREEKQRARVAEIIAHNKKRQEYLEP